MQFAFTDDQLAFRDAVRDLLDEGVHARARARRVDERRPAACPGCGTSSPRWACVGDARARSDGGLGLDEVDLVLVLEETGRAAVPEPIVETAAFGVPLLGARRRHGRRDRARAACRGPTPPTSIVTARRPRSTAPTVELVPRDRRSTAPAACSRCSGDPASRVDGDAQSRRTTAARCGIAAQLCGLADRMLEMTAEYVKERQQFGVPVGSFQAVKHHLANARIALEFARPLVYRAACVDRDGDPTRRPRVDGQGQGRRGRARGREAALQCHGAIGYTTEYDLHLYMKRAWALAAAWGDAALPPDRVADARSCEPDSTEEIDDARGLHRRRRAHARSGKRNGGLAQVHPADLGAHSIRALDRPRRRRPGRRRRRRVRLRRHDRPAGRRHRAHVLARRRAARRGAGHDRRPAVRLVAAGRALRGAGRDVRARPTSSSRAACRT